MAAVSAVAFSFLQAAEAQERAPEVVVVTAERIEAALDAERAATPGAVTNLDGAKFYERRIAELSDMLRYVPGVYAESYNGNDDVFYSSRGSNLDATHYDKNGIKFLQDGLPVSAADGNNHNRALDPFGARYVTVAHGANALAYGASTLGGAVDFTTPTARTTLPSVSASVGSFGERGVRASFTTVFSDALDGLVMAESQQRDGYRAHSAQDRRGLYANLGWAASSNVAMRFFATYVDYDAELPRELTPAQFVENPRQARQDAILGDHGKALETRRFAFKTTVARLAEGTLELGVSHENQELYHPIVSSPFFSLLIDTTHEDSGAMLRYRRTAGAHALLFGMNYGYSTVTGGNYRNNGGRPGALMWMTDNSASSLELFALDRWNFAADWTLVYGAQFVSADRDVSGFEGSYDSANPRVGVIRRLGDAASEWYASASRVYEAPTTFELVDDFNGGSTPLEAMRGVVVETGLRGTAPRGDTRLNWDVSVYYTELRDEILSRDNPNAPGTSLAANIDETTHAGIEALLGASFALSNGGRIEPLLNVTFNAFSFDSDPVYGDNRLPAAPRFFVRGEVLYRNRAGFSVGPMVDLIGDRYADFANTYRVDDYTLLGLRVGYKTDKWELFAEARNLRDEDYVAAVVVKDVAALDAAMLFPGMPRSYHFGARRQF
jgi:iron complex outermembrane receptor protein